MREEHLIHEFIAEAEDHLLLLEPQLLQLEKDPENAALMQDIFVATHAIKGTAAYVGLTHISEFTHLLESVLDRLRQGEMRASPETIDILLQGMDSLTQLIQHVAAGKPAPDTSEIERTLAQWHPSSSVPLSEHRKSSEPTPSFQSTLFPSDELQALDREDLEIFADIAGQQLESMQLSCEHLKHALGSEDHVPEDALTSSAMSISKAFRTIQSSATMLDMPSLHTHIAEQASVMALLDAPDTLSEQVLEDVSYALAHLEPLVSTLADWIRQPVESPEFPQAVSTPSAGDGFPPDTPVSPHMLRVDADRVDALLNLAGELVVNRARLTHIEDAILALHEDVRAGTVKYLNPTPESRKTTIRVLKNLQEYLNETTTELGHLANRLQEGAMRIRMIPLSHVVSRFPRMVRDLSRQSGKEVTIDIRGADTELDKSVIDIIADPYDPSSSQCHRPWNRIAG